MAEALAGLAVAASVIAVIQISEQVITVCIDSFLAAKDTKTDIQTAILVIGGLKATLENLKKILDETEDDELPHLKTLDKPLETCFEAIDSIGRKLGINVIKWDKALEKLEFSITKRITWRWKKKEVNKILGRIERHTETFILAVAGDTLRTTLVTQADMGEIKDGIGTLKDDVSKVKSNVSVIPTFVSDQRTKAILSWLKTNDPSTNHASARQKHEPTTGNWFIRSTAFTTWKSAPKSALWLHGIPGAGKTVLCSTIIEHVKTLCGPESQLAYFYFDFNEPQKETINGMLRSMILQLCTAPGREKVLSVVDDLFKQCNDGIQQPPLQSLINTLFALIASSPQTYLIMDALDECIERNKLTELIRHILEGSKHVNLLTTSRREQDLVEGLEGIMNVQMDLRQSDGIDLDIKLHVRKYLDNDKRLRKWKSPVKEEILNALFQGALGMFRWVECQLDSLRKCLTPGAVRKTLSQLPKTLDETYNRILQCILGEYQREAKCILHLLVISRRPLTLYEVAEAVAVDCENERFDVENRLRDPNDILEICSSLVSVRYRATWGTGVILYRGQNEELGFAHYSVREYLVSDRIQSEFRVTRIEANRIATKISLIYLISFDSLTRSSMTNFPFLRYAAKFWPDHARVLEDCEQPELELVLKLLAPNPETINKDICEGTGSPRCCLNWLELYDPDRKVFFGEINVFPPVWYYSSLLGLLSLTEWLFQNGAELRNTRGWFDTALQAASVEGHVSIVRFLLDNNLVLVSEGSRTGQFSGPLEAAVARGHLSVVETLIEKGANIDQESGERLLLYLAARGGHLQVVRYLLENGADLHQLEAAPYGGIALESASRVGDVAMIRFLLDMGANIDLRGHFGNALQTACKWRSHELVWLLKEGSNVNVEAGLLGNAYVPGSGSIVRMLLDNGANVNANPGSDGTALRCAVNGRYASPTIVKWLLDKGADVNATGVESEDYAQSESSSDFYLGELDDYANETPLQIAAVWGSEPIVRLLLEHGAEVNTPPGPYGTALQIARAGGYQEIVELLLKHGAQDIPGEENVWETQDSEVLEI